MKTSTLDRNGVSTEMVGPDLLLVVVIVYGQRRISR